MIVVTKFLIQVLFKRYGKLFELVIEAAFYTGISIDEITMVIVIDGDVTAGRKRRNTNVQTMQDLICTQVIVFTA